MSLYGALISGVSGLSANSQAMGVISDNISNLNSVGYKGSAAQFSTLVTGSSGNSYTPGGVQARTKALVDRQGVLQSSTSATDLALTGNGFFVVSPTPDSRNFVYTRAGSFSADSKGNLVNSAGFALKGVAADAAGNLPTNFNLAQLSTINVGNLSGSPTPTSKISIGANLKADQVVNPLVRANATPGYTNGSLAAKTIPADFERAITVYDSLGVARTLNVAFLKTADANKWKCEIYSVPASVTTGTNGLVANGEIEFNGDGSVKTMPTALTAVTVSWQAQSGVPTAFTPVATQNISFDFGAVGSRTGLSQVQGDSTLRSVDADGSAPGALAGVSIDKDGIVTARFSNGTSRPVYRIALANFANPNGLKSETGNAYSENLNSGIASLNYANTAGLASVSSSALEGSTVDLAREFSDMIITQRAYSASSKIITTADDMLDELIRTKR